MYAISTLLFLVAGKASRVPKVTYYFSWIVEYLLKLSMMCKSPLHGPRNHVGRTCEWSADYSARMFGRHSCVARATAICILLIVESFRSCFPTTRNKCRNCPKKFTIDILSINLPRKLMEKDWFPAPMSRLMISSALLNILFLKLSTTIFQLPGPSN